MKKRMVRLSAVITAVFMLCGLCACGGKEYATVSGGAKKYESVSDYVNSINRSYQIYEKEISGDDDVEVQITAEGDVMVYTFRFEDMEKSDELSEALESELAKEDKTFLDAADEIRQYVNVETATVEVRYVDRKDELVYSKKYTSAAKK